MSNKPWQRVRAALSRLVSDTRLPSPQYSRLLERRSETNEEKSKLFYCPDCDTVYIAIEKRICSSCEEAVQTVPATLQEVTEAESE